jgi:excisionase family DNA binding protein
VAFGSGGRGPSRPSVTKRSQALGTIGDSEPTPVQPSQGVAGSHKTFAAPLLQGPPPAAVNHRSTSARLRALPSGAERLLSGAERLLTVREVAERLGVCTAAIYGLCGRGELPHVRVSNAIRIRPVDVDDLERLTKVRTGAAVPREEPPQTLLLLGALNLTGSPLTRYL